MILERRAVPSDPPLPASLRYGRAPPLPQRSHFSPPARAAFHRNTDKPASLKKEVALDASEARRFQASFVEEGVPRVLDVVPGDQHARQAHAVA